MTGKWLIAIAIAAATMSLAAPAYGANPVVVGETPRVLTAGELDPATDCVIAGGGVCQELLADRDDPAGPRLRAFVATPACAPGCPPGPTGSTYGLAKLDATAPIKNMGDLDGLDGTVKVKGKWRYRLFNGGLPPAGACYSRIRIKVKLTAGAWSQERTIKDETLEGNCGNEVEEQVEPTSFLETFAEVPFRKGEEFKLTIWADAFAESASAAGVASSKADFDVFVEEAKITFPPPPYFSMVETPGGYSEVIADLPGFVPPAKPYFVLGPFFTVKSLYDAVGKVTLSSPFCRAAGGVFNFSICPDPLTVPLAAGGHDISVRGDFYELGSVMPTVLSVPFEAVIAGTHSREPRSVKVTFTGKACATAVWLSAEAQTCPANPAKPKAKKPKPKPSKVTICHKGKTKKVTKKASGKLRKQGAKRGACKGKKGR